MADFSQQSTILVTSPKGVAPILAAELAGLGHQQCRELTAGVEIRGSLEDCMALNLQVRTGHRVLWQLDRFRCHHPDELLQRVVDLPWEDYVSPDVLLTTSAVANTPTIRDNRFASLRLKDGICDRLRSVHGKRPDSGPARTGSCVFLHWQDDQCTIYMDTSGLPLSRRGYRKMPHKAPMQETLAAACVLHLDWPRLAREGGSFVSPMCGSGTPVIEAALAGLNRAPGLLRSAYAMTHLPGFPQDRWTQLRSELRNRAEKTLPGRIVATDHDPRAVEAARQNARTAGVEQLIEFDVCDYRETPVPPAPGVVFMNPEYGERLGQEKALEGVYSGIGDDLKQRYPGYVAGLFTGNLRLAKRVGLRTSRRVQLFNASIDSRLLVYELYRGSKKRD